MLHVLKISQIKFIPIEGLGPLVLTASMEVVSTALVVTILESSAADEPPQPPDRQRDTGTTP